METCNHDGLDRLSTLTSEKQRFERGSKVRSEGHVISPDRRNPKKHRHDAAHNIFAFRKLGSLFHLPFSAVSMVGVIGRRHLELSGVAFFAPFSTYSTWGMEWILGLPMPRAI